MFISGSIGGWNQHFYKKNTSSTTQQFKPFQDDEETSPKRLKPFVPVFDDMGSPVKNQVKNDLNNIFNFRGQTIDMSDQAIFNLKDVAFIMKEGKNLT